MLPLNKRIAYLFNPGWIKECQKTHKCLETNKDNLNSMAETIMSSRFFIFKPWEQDRP